jgi:acyl transferase domain-containing protein
MQEFSDDIRQNSVAVIGMAGKFYNAPSLEAFWENLEKGVEAVRFLDRESLIANGSPTELLSHPMFVPATASLEDADLFDAEFFGFTPAEAQIMDPQLRLMLQTAWHAFENANIIPGEGEGLTGVFAGCHPSSYLHYNLGPEYAVHQGMKTLTAALFNGQDFPSTWLSYKLGLTGPSINVQTACSTGLVAVATACQNLLDYSCDLALATAAAVFCPRDRGYLAETGSIFSSDGHCRPWDSAATGTISGEGAGAVLLKRLQDALQDGDRIIGVIRGYAINNDGSGRAGFSTPSVKGQKVLLEQALAAAGVQSSEIAYVEGHGTGTPLGDPVEFKALDAVFGQVPRGRRCLLGSLKANIGHLGACAGMASLLKVLLMLERGIVPPQINFSEANKEIPLARSAFAVQTTAEPWPSGARKLAGISSFGLGGTNCHMIVEGLERNDSARSALDSEMVSSAPLPLCLSAKSPESLAALCRDWAVYLDRQGASSLRTHAQAALFGRQAMPWRISVCGPMCEQAARELHLLAGQSFRREDQGQKLALICPNRPTVSDNLIKSLMEQDIFRRILEEIATRLPEVAVFTSDDRTGAGTAPTPLSEALEAFILCLGLGNSLLSLGIKPDFLILEQGNSPVGKVLAGKMSLVEALETLRSLYDPAACANGSRQDSGTAAGKTQDALYPSEPSDARLVFLSAPDAEAFFLQAGEFCLKHKIGVAIALGIEAFRQEKVTGGCANEAGMMFVRFPAPCDGAMEQGTGLVGYPCQDAPTQKRGNETEGFMTEEFQVHQALAAPLSALFRAGVALLPERGKKLPPVPLYPFRRQRHWVEPSRQSSEHASHQCACKKDVALAEKKDAEQATSNAQSIESLLCGIWNEALGIADIAPEDDFFMRGGTSLSAIAIIARIERETGLTVPLREFLKLRTIHAVMDTLATLAEQHRDSIGLAT